MQDFYDDIINRFTMFLMENPAYSPILATLYNDVQKPSKQPQETAE